MGVNPVIRMLAGVEAASGRSALGALVNFVCRGVLYSHCSVLLSTHEFAGVVFRELSAENVMPVTPNIVYKVGCFNNTSKPIHRPT